MNKNISSDLIVKILNAAQRYPSGDNNQPFYLKKVAPQKFEIFHDAEIAEHSINIENTMSKVTLGCYLAYLELASIKYQVKLNYKILQLNDSQLPWAEFDFSPLPLMDSNKQQNNQTKSINDIDQFLCAHLDARYTERRPFRVKAEQPKGLDLFIASEKIRTPVQFEWSFQSQLEPRALRYMGDLEKQFWLTPSCAWQTFQWVRLTNKEIYSTRDGMPAAALGVPAPAVLALYFMRRWEVLVRILTHLGLALNQKIIQQKLLRSSSLVGIIFVPKIENDLSFVWIGQHYARLWLWLRANNWAFQPVSISTLLYGLYRLQRLPNAFEKIIDFFRERGEEFEKYFTPRNCNGWIPVWGFRAGPHEKLPPVTPTLRRIISSE